VLIRRGHGEGHIMLLPHWHIMLPCCLYTLTAGRVKSDMEEEDDDVEYYRQEVGEEPDPGICLHSVIGLWI